MQAAARAAASADDPAGPVVLLVGSTSADGSGLERSMRRLSVPFIAAKTAADAGVIVRRRDDVAVVLAHFDQQASSSADALVRQLRQQAPLVPVVLFGRVDDPASVVRAVRAGAADFVAGDEDSAGLSRLLDGFLQVREHTPVFESAASRRSFELAGRVAATDVSVLITGESGTGKEVVARFIHEHSNRAAGPFVGVNCAAIPEQMMEATLFGHEKGAFTGAHQSRPGKFEICEGGTLLLDEISEMSLELQAKLLRVLQEREVERIGAHQSRVVDVRVLATSNRDLREAVRLGRFREDLFYRLSVFPLQLDPLRDRVEDILPLARWFLAKHGSRMGKGDLALSQASCEALVAHPWVGNVRELENAIQRSLVLVEGPVVEPGHLGIEPVDVDPPSSARLESQVRNAEEQLIQQALASCNGRRKEAARALGISERTLRYKLQKLREREEVLQ